MKTLLICPAHRPAVARLADARPLVLVPILGKCLLEYWLEHLVTQGVREVRIIASDRPARVHEFVGDGSRWGLRLELSPESYELTPAEARARSVFQARANDVAPPDDVVLIDHLPGLDQSPLFESYDGWFQALLAWLPHACATTDRIGRREISPGVWVGLHSRITPGAQLHAPCWIGENVFVGPDTVIGPGAILEDRAFIENGTHIVQSVVGPETFVGELTRIEQSLAHGDLLINWKTHSCLTVPDAFLLCSLGERAPLDRPVSRAWAPLTSLRHLIPRQQE